MLICGRGPSANEAWNPQDLYYNINRMFHIFENVSKVLHMFRTMTLVERKIEIGVKFMVIAFHSVPMKCTMSCLTHLIQVLSFIIYVHFQLPCCYSNKKNVMILHNTHPIQKKTWKQIWYCGFYESWRTDKSLRSVNGIQRFVWTCSGMITSHSVCLATRPYIQALDGKSLSQTWNIADYSEYILPTTPRCLKCCSRRFGSTSSRTSFGTRNNQKRK